VDVAWVRVNKYMVSSRIGWSYHAPLGEIPRIRKIDDPPSSTATVAKITMLNNTGNRGHLEILFNEL
jgi:hypothetical protein